MLYAKNSMLDVTNTKYLSIPPGAIIPGTLPKFKIYTLTPPQIRNINPKNLNFFLDIIFIFL